MSCSLNQAGGARTPNPKVSEVEGTRKTLANGAVGATFLLADGKKGFRFISGPTLRVAPRAITQDQAQAAFNKYYAKIQNVRRGPRKGSPVFHSQRGLRSARTYDRNHTKSPARVITDSRYLSPSGPRQWDYTNVDTGDRVRMALSERQKLNLTAGRAKGVANRLARRPVSGQVRSQNADILPPMQQKPVQQGGYWW